MQTSVVRAEVVAVGHQSDARAGHILERSLEGDTNLYAVCKTLLIVPADRNQCQVRLWRDTARTVQVASAISCCDAGNCGAMAPDKISILLAHAGQITQPPAVPVDSW